MDDPTNLFPNRKDPHSMALSSEELSMEGMKVIFDENVTLFPVDLEPKQDSTPKIVRLGRNRRIH